MLEKMPRQFSGEKKSLQKMVVGQLNIHLQKKEVGHFSDSVSVLIVCLVFVFIIFLSFGGGSFVDSWESVVILLFTVFDLQFLR